MEVANSIHHFERAPIDEVVLGVQFANTNLSLLDAGLFWAAVRDDFPKRQITSPLITQMETFEAPFPLIGADDPIGAAMAATGPAFARAWFHSADETRLLQLQGDRLLVNWRARPHARDYPRYAAVRDMFATAFNKLLSFAAAQEMGEPVPIQAEVSYFNRIAPVNGFGNPHAVFRNWAPLSVPGLSMPGEPETAAFRLTRRIYWPDSSPAARLHVRMSPAFSPESGYFFLLELTARGAPAGSTLDDVHAFHDLCREVVVRTFAALTTDEMHAHWARTS